MSPLVPPQATIAVVAPASTYREDRFQAGLAVAREQGHRFVLAEPLHEPWRTFAAPDEVRLAQLTWALTDPSIDAVWAVRGGYGVTRLLPRLDFSQLLPKPVIGFSDLTPLLEALRVRLGAECIHGPVLHSLATTSEATREAFFELLHTGTAGPFEGHTLAPGHASGPLVGGNLAMICATIGTPWQLQTEGALLFLEDVGEAPYRIDRMLTQVRQAGLLDGLAGIALGTFEGCEPPAGAGYTLHDIFDEHLGRLGIPVLTGLPFGHGRDNIGLPVGRTAHLAQGHLHLAVPPTIA